MGDEETVSQYEAYIQSKGWEYKPSGSSQLNLEVCPYCGKNNYHFYINKDTGLWQCQKCGEAGNIYKLAASQGDRVAGVTSTKEMGQAGKSVGALPNVDNCHESLMNNEALDYLVHDRGFSLETIEKQKLGLTMLNGQPYIVIPYFANGQVTYAKFRSVPPAKKDYRGISGREVGIFNEDALKPGLDELMLVEGEMDCIACLNAGVVNVVGVPGANIKKASWIEKLDECAPKKIYILYDSDKVGQAAARDMAARIGIDKVYNVTLPEFTTLDGNKGKDINEWLRAGHLFGELEELKAKAKPFDVLGVTSTMSALEELEQELENKASLTPRYTSPWPSLNVLFGGMEYGDVLDVMGEGKMGKSTMVLDWADFIVQNYNESALVYCLEMSQVRLVRKWVSYITQTDDSPAHSEEESISRLQSMKDAVKLAKDIAAAREGDLLFAYNKVTKPDDVYDTIRQAVRRYGVKFVVFDNLQLLADLTLDKAYNRTVHLSKISKSLKALATELNIVIIRVIQPNRVKDTEIAGAHNADGASQIEKDCDAMIIIHRNEVAPIKKADFQTSKFMESAGTFEPQMLVKVALSRYAGGGMCTLRIDGNTSTVREWSDDEYKSLTPQALPGEVPINQVQEV